MICRASRDRLALGLRRYVSGKIHNEELDAIAIDWKDQGAAAAKMEAWFLYSDLCQHYAIGKHSLSKEQKRLVAQWIVFLHGNSEYLWPERRWSLAFLPINLLTFGWWGRRKFREFKKAGDIEAWPFLQATDRDRAASQPRFLAGIGRRSASDQNPV